MGRRRLAIAVAAVMLIAAPLAAEPPGARSRTISQDTDGDGRTDRIARLSAGGVLERLDVDTDGDGQMDTVQHYRDGVVVTIERDTDADGVTDVRDFMDSDRPTRREALDVTGRITGTLVFDVDGRPLRWQRDTTGDGRMDTDQRYEDGCLRSVTRDTTGDGRVNQWQTFEDDLPCEQRQDADGDGRVEQVVFMDALGRPSESRHDLDGDGSLETRQVYEKGEIRTRLTDTDGDGRFNVVVRYAKGAPAVREEDADGDGRMDRFTDFDADGRPSEVRETDPGTGAVLRLSRYAAGCLKSVEARDGCRVSLTRFKEDRPTLQTVDVDGDGTPEQTIHYDDQGRIGRSVSDSDGDGRPDTWQFFEEGQLARIERDRDGEGRVDLRQTYTGAALALSEMDNDGDGRCEISVRHDDPRWSRVEMHSTAEGIVSLRRVYAGDVLRRREDFDKNTGRPLRVEEFDTAGRIVKSREAEAGSDRLTLTWHYDADGTAVLAEKDSDGDGAVDTWFHYEDGRIVRVAEDRNRDGRPDLWETYDAAEVMISRSEDLDFDGTADLESKQ